MQALQDAGAYKPSKASIQLNVGQTNDVHTREQPDTLGWVHSKGKRGIFACFKLLFIILIAGPNKQHKKDPKMTLVCGKYRQSRDL